MEKPIIGVTPLWDEEKNNKGTLNNYLGTLKKMELVVIGEIGFVPLHKR